MIVSVLAPFSMRDLWAVVVPDIHPYIHRVSQVSY